MKPHIKGQKEWKKAIVWQRLDERSYHIKVNGELHRWNRVDLKKTTEAPPLPSLIYQPYQLHSEVPVNVGLGTEETCNPQTSQQENDRRERVIPKPNPERVRMTRSVRLIRNPARFKDYTS